MDSVQTAFDKAYWASEPPELQALPAIEDFTQRSTRAAVLAAQGFVVDVPIMVWSWDPYLVMTMRSNYGYTWVPSALQSNVLVAPGVSQPGTVPYDPAHPPTGSIRVSTSLADYPPLNPPVAVPLPANDGDPV